MARLLIVLCGLAMFGAPASAQDTRTVPRNPVEFTDATDREPVLEDVLEILDGAETDLNAFLWTRRPVMVFADTPADPRFAEQMDLLAARPGPLLERDVVVITDTDPAARSPARLKLRPRGFALIVIDKDGRVMLRKPTPWDVREITRAIDKTQLRQDEMRLPASGG